MVKLDKIYNQTDPEFDPAEREEEQNLMREHYFNEIDKDKDGMISLEEFVNESKENDFKNDEEWKVATR